MVFERLSRQIARLKPIRSDLASRSVTIGFPRSGTNYFQSLLAGLGGISAGSIYTGQHFDNIKSHALSFEYLQDEFRIFNSKVDDNFKVYLILRDPRDIFISFYEFYLSRDQGHISQKDFLNMDWFLAYSRGTARTDLRSKYLYPMTVAEAAVEFAVNWMSKPTNSDRLLYSSNILEMVRYEQLVQPEYVISLFESNDILAADLDVESNLRRYKEISSVKVSQYSSEPDRERAAAYGYKSNNTYNEYRDLIKSVENNLFQVIELFGYSS